MESQLPNIEKSSGFAGRVLSVAVLLIIVLFFTVMNLAENGFIKPAYVLGVCGFKQRYGLPCPGCGWTHSAQAFATGDVVRSFVIQPAAAFFCGLLLIIAILALHTLIFGVHSKLREILTNNRFWKYSLIGLASVVLLGWIVTLARSLASNGG